MTDIPALVSRLSPVQQLTLRSLKAGGGELAAASMSGPVRKALEHRGLITPSKHLTNLGYEVIEHLETA